MANLNLSQFGENTSVSDADYTFVWDSANAISKKVSRNSWLNSGTLTSDAPVTISQTWNAVGQTFKALVVNAAGTSDANSAAGSLLADFQLGGVSKAWVTKQGGYRASNGQFVSGNGIGFAGGLNTGFYSIGGEQIFVAANNSVPIEFKSTSIVVNLTTTFGFGQVGVGADTILLRDGAANTLALRNGAAAQTFRVYNTYTDASNYERAVFGYGSNQINLGSDVAGSGVHRKLNILGAGIDFYHAGIGIRWSINTSGHFIAAADNSYDIGASNANRPRNIFTAGAINIGSGFGVTFSGTTVLFPIASGNLRIGNTTDTSGYRLNGATLDYCKVQKFDGTGFGSIQGKLTTDTAFTAGAITDTGYIVLYDSNGVAYKVACTPA